MLDMGIESTTLSTVVHVDTMWYNRIMLLTIVTKTEMKVSANISLLFDENFGDSISILENISDDRKFMFTIYRL